MESAWMALGVVVLAGAAWAFWARGRRGRELKRLMAHLGLRLAPDAGAIKRSALLESPLFAPGDGHASHVFLGDIRDAEAVIFEYALCGHARRGHPDPVAFFRHKQNALAAFELRPRASRQDAAGLLFQEAQRFSEVYALAGDDETALRTLFRTEVLGFFERAENQDWALVSNAAWLGVTRWPLGKRARPLAPKEVAGFVEDAKRLLYLLAAQPPTTASREEQAAT